MENILSKLNHYSPHSGKLFFFINRREYPLRSPKQKECKLGKVVDLQRVLLGSLI